MRKIAIGLLYLVLIASAIIAVYPFILMVFGSLKRLLNCRRIPAVFLGLLRLKTMLT